MTIERKRSLERKRLLFWAALPAILLGAIYFWIATAGSWRHWSKSTSFYSQLSEAFVHGRLSLLTEPSPALLAERNPYTPAGHLTHDIVFDASLFDGKYYLYWGPVPALIGAACCWISGISHPHFSDRLVSLVFAYGMVITAAALIFQIRARLFPDQPFSSGVAAIVSLALGTPVLFALGNAAIYEAAVFAGQFFLLAGILAAWCGLRQDAGPPKRSRPLLFAAAGLCWAAACGSRVSLPPAVIAIAALTIWRLLRPGPDKSRRYAMTPIAALAGSLAVGFALLAWYNHARFGSIAEFGWRYQLTREDQTRAHATGYVAARNILYNLDADFLTPPILRHVFPYFFVDNARPWMATHFPMPRVFFAERIVGLIWSQPFFIFAPAAIVAIWLPRKTLSSAATGGQSDAHWLTGTLAAAASLGIAPALLIAYSSPRYLLDMVPCVTVLAAIGYWQVLEHLKPYPRLVRELRSIVRLLVLVQCVVGLLLTIGDSVELLNSLP